VGDQMAQYAEFFSYGTMTRRDHGHETMLKGNSYLNTSKGVLPANPFQVLDPEGVGYLIKLGVEKGR
jgi:pyruvate,orthophosphate dikinase